MRIISMLFGLLFISLQAMGQGTIAGTVKDEKTGEEIIGASVSIKGATTGTVTDVDGNYTLKVAAGTHTVLVRYLGYKPKEVADVKVDAKAKVSLNIALSSATDLEEVVVTTTMKKENVAALYTIQKNNVSVSSGISADIIQRSPDRNTGEVLKRVSGASVQNDKFVVIRGLSDRYNTAMLNSAQMPSTEPDRKAFSFDIIPSNLIDNIIISKTASADLPGDFAGGVVQVMTKDVPDENFYNLGLTLGYNNQSTFKDYTTTKTTTGEYLGFANKDNALPAAFGADVTAYKSMSRAEQLSAARQLPNNFQYTTGTALPNTSLQLSAGNVQRFKNGGKFGTVVGLSYRNGYKYAPEFVRATWNDDASNNSYATDQIQKFNSSLSGLANFSYMSGKSRVTFRNIFNALHDMNTIYRTGTNYSSSQEVRMNSNVPLDRTMYSSQLEGDHAIGKKNIKVYWNLNYSNLTAKQYDLRTAFYNRPLVLQSDGTYVPDDNAPYVLTDRNSRRFFSNLTDNSYGGNFYVNVPFELFSQKQSVKVGYLGLYKDRSFGARIFQYQPYDQAQLNPASTTLPYDQILGADNISQTGYELNEITNPTDQYTANALLNAGYVMLDNHFTEKFRMSWGARVESYSQTLQAVNLSKTSIDTTSTVIDILPSINLSYDFSEKTKVRLSGSRTVNRPEFREVAPFEFVDFENMWTVNGNRNLGRANITNVDLRYEYYPAPGEVVTLGAFYKYFNNPIESIMNSQTNNDLFKFTYGNAVSAQAYGVELDVRKNLGFISDDAQWLENLVVGANVTYIKSVVDISNQYTGTTADTIAARPLQGQSPYLFNFSILYTAPKSGLSISALYNRIGDRIFIVGTNQFKATWERGRDVIDVQVSKKVLKGRGEVKLTVSDLLNQATIFYWDYDNQFGYNKNNDRVFQSYKYGTNFNLGFTYRFGK
ncbi:MAG: TonB-dependent receptor [Flavipsychrobacter sp.]|nr:TonB-dependent receptor [Flavipsychrobacter sp.]